MGQFYIPIWPIGGSLLYADSPDRIHQRGLDTSIVATCGILWSFKEDSGQLGGAGSWHRVCFIYVRL